MAPLRFKCGNAHTKIPSSSHFRTIGPYSNYSVTVFRILVDLTVTRNDQTINKFSKYINFSDKKKKTRL